MAFERDVIIGGYVRSTHVITSVEHIAPTEKRQEGLTIVNVSSDGFMSSWERALDDDMGLSEAEQWVMSLSEFQPYKNPGEALMDEITSMLTDDQALSVPNAYPIWEPGMQYQIGQRVRSGGVLYKVLQAHVSQEGWEPSVSASLFAALSPEQDDDGGVVVPEWQQPGSTNPYMRGDKVVFEGSVYESLIDNNIWSPMAYPQGWMEVSL